MLVSVLLHNGVNHENEFFSRFEIIKLHAALMVVAWLFFMNIGSVFARYLKFPPNRVYQWYKHHVTLQVIGMICCILAFIIIVLHYASVDETHFISGIHQFLGLILMIMTLLQPILGYLAHKVFLATKKSSNYHTYHRWIGRFLNIFAFITIAFGLKLFFNNDDDDGEAMMMEKRNAVNNEWEVKHYAWFCFVVVLITTIAVYFIFEIWGNFETYDVSATNNNNNNRNSKSVKRANFNLIINNDGEFEDDNNTSFDLPFSRNDDITATSADPAVHITNWKIWINQIIFFFYSTLLFTFVIPIIYCILLI